MLNNSAKQKFEELVDSSINERDRVRDLIHEGKWRQAEPSESRKVLFNLKDKIRLKQNGAESQIGDTLDWLDVTFFAEGASIIRAVGYITVLTDTSTGSGSGFLISNKLLMTNNHVISNIEKARAASVTFNKENDEIGKALATTVYRLDPDKFFLTSPQDELDFTIVAIGNKEYGELNVEDLGYFILSDAPDKHVIGMPVNIIQHPLDLPKKVSFRKNDLVLRTDNSLLYEADTETCSSGSPVCNDYWDLVALHHWGQPYKAKRDNPDSDLPNYVNEGIRISAIYKKLSAELESLDTPQKKDLLLETLSFAKLQPAVFKKQLTKKPQAEAESADTTQDRRMIKKENTDSSETNTKNNMLNNSNEINFTLPLEISIRIGGQKFRASEGKEPVGKPSISPGAEAVEIDTNYSNRSGYASDFIKGYDIPLPRVKNKENIAPLKSGEENREAGVLNYEHFAIILNKKYKAAYFSATNMDGKTYKAISRETGGIKNRDEMNESENEKWFNDKRIDEKYHLNQPFFSDGWSLYFDRGHLTRRTDPSWGSDKVAYRADADTFHFSNCTLMHFRFNQTVQYWQGLEQYVLETGLLKADIDSRLTVFQGPIYNDDIDLWAGDEFQVPSRFFKIVIWEGNNGLKAVGLVADQSSLLQEERKKLGPRKVPFVNVSEFRTRIADIEKITGLDFGDVIRSADSIGQTNQPQVGAEAMVKIPITSWADAVQ